MGSLDIVLISIVFIFLTISYESCAEECSFVIDVPGESYTLDDIDGITIDSDRTIGETIFTVMIQNKPTNRRKRGFGASDVYLVSNSSRFGVRYTLAVQHQIYVLSCLQAGYTETLELGIWDSRDNGLCNDSSLTISVSGGAPVFAGNSTEVYADRCAADGTIIEVMSLSLGSSGGCEKQWNCTANCTTHDKLFWVEQETLIYTYSDGIIFIDMYDVEITCAEIGDISPNISSKNKQIYSVQFRENQTTCPTTTTISTAAQASTITSASPTSYIQENKAFLDDPANAAIVFTVGGVAIVSTVGAGVYMVIKEKCIAQSVNTV